MNNLTEAEINEIMIYTGMDLLMAMPEWRKTPVVHWCRDKRGVIQFITILKDISPTLDILCIPKSSDVE